MKQILNTYKHHVVCVKNKGYEVSLERRKIYRVQPDKQAAERGLLRVIDESKQSYLYPYTLFAPIKLTSPLIKALALAA
jgi:hypothetical protein